MAYKFASAVVGVVCAVALSSSANAPMAQPIPLTLVPFSSAQSICDWWNGVDRVDFSNQSVYAFNDEITTAMVRWCGMRV